MFSVRVKRVLMGSLIVFGGLYSLCFGLGFSGTWITFDPRTFEVVALVFFSCASLAGALLVIDDYVSNRKLRRRE